MKNENEIKIGIFAMSALFLLIIGWAFLRELALHKQTTFYVSFKDTVGLSKGSFIKINGVRVGRVDSLTLDLKTNKVLVKTRIQLPDIRIPDDSKFIIRTSGYVGDKFLDIALGMASSFIKDDQEIAGEPAVDAFASLEKISKVLDHIDPELLAMDIQNTASSAATLTKNADKAVLVASREFSSTNQEFSSALNQRFLLPKLLFGKVLPNSKIDKKKKNAKDDKN
jgi:ABC-type transporter Mla subunit MlaD